MTRREKILQGVARDAAYYRSNPHRFAKDYLHLDLHLFQKIVLVMMNTVTTFTFIGARGIGKTFLSAIFCTIRCILWPETKIVIASGTRGQSNLIIEKILLELKPRSPELAAEIDDKQTKSGGNDAKIVFKNGSYIKVVTSGESGRGNRANVLLLDEFRLISKDVIDTILRKFLAQKRKPAYAKIPKKERERYYSKELNQMLFLSSAFFTDHWSYRKCTDTCQFMLDDTKRQFICGLPYQLSIKEGLLDEDAVLDEMAEADFNEIKFSMEYAALWWGDSDGTFFDYATIAKNRRIKYPMLPDSLSSKLANSQKTRIPPKTNGEKRILSADIALISSTKNNNDATAIFINQLIPNKNGRYSSNIVYTETSEGLHTSDQALIIRRLYEEFQCDYIVLDTLGIGLGVFDCLARDMTDPATGEIYPALSCYNDSVMAERCPRGADKVIWSIKANATMNSECAVLLREAFKSGKIRLLASEYDGEENLSEIKGFSSLSEQDKAKLLLPYVNTTLLINELVKLRHEESGGKIKISEASNMRKDRYSSLAYNYYVATCLETKFNKVVIDETQDLFVIKPPKARTTKHRKKGW